MLVLSRRTKETITLYYPGGCIELTVKEIQGKAVKLIFDAPKEVRIVRGELENVNERKAAIRNVVAQSLTQYLAQTERTDSAASTDKV